MRSRLILAVLAGMLTIGVVGGILYGIIFSGLFASNRGSATGVIKSPDLLLGRPRSQTYALSQCGTTNLWMLKLTFVEPLITMVMIGIAGPVVGTVLGHARPHYNEKPR